MESSNRDALNGVMSNDTTLVLGATGKTGRRVAARLRMHRVPVRAASRSSRTPFDWSDPTTWDPALRGVAALAQALDHAFLSIEPGELGLHEDIIGLE